MIASEEAESPPDGHTPAPFITDTLSATRIFCGAMVMPTVSALVGRMFFESIQNSFHRAIIGGLSFIVVKGGLKMYFQHKQQTRKKQRQILDHNIENVRRFGTHPLRGAAMIPVPRRNPANAPGADV